MVFVLRLRRQLSKVGKTKLIAPTCITQVLLQLRKLPATCVSKGHLHQSLASNIHMCYAPLSDSPIPLLSTNSGSYFSFCKISFHTYERSFLCCLCKGSPIYAPFGYIYTCDLPCFTQISNWFFFGFQHEAHSRFYSCNSPSQISFTMCKIISLYVSQNGRWNEKEIVLKIIIYML